MRCNRLAVGMTLLIGFYAVGFMTPKAAAGAEPADNADWSGTEYPAEQVVFEAPANYMRGREAVGGRIKITGEALHFDSHNFNFQTGSSFIPLDHVTAFDRYRPLGISNNGLIVITEEGTRHRFVVNNRDKIIALIQDIKAFQVQAAEKAKAQETQRTTRARRGFGCRSRR